MTGTRLRLAFSAAIDRIEQVLPPGGRRDFRQFRLLSRDAIRRLLDNNPRDISRDEILALYWAAF